MTALSFFNSLFPSHRLIYADGELRYGGFAGEDLARIYAQTAAKIIREKRLALIVAVETWASRAGIRWELVVMDVPDEVEFIHDEQDEPGDYWGRAEENEVWERLE